MAATISQLPDNASNLPRAELKPRRRISLAWIVPVIALLAVGWILWQAWVERGIDISIEFDQVHGLKVGDPVRFRGASVGKVREIALNDDLQGLSVTAQLDRSAEALARPGTRFWIVRPSVGLEGAAGLDTIVGPRYIAAAPPANSIDNSRPSTARPMHFIGLADAPLIDSDGQNDLEIVLYAANRGSLAPGAPLLYRQFRIGTITSVELAPDAGSIEARARVEGPYVPLVRENSRFWDAGGYTARLGWRGLTFEIDSLQTLVTGGVAMATPSPERAGGMVQDQTRFEIAPEPEKAWLEWQPLISLHRPAGSP